MDSLDAMMATTFGILLPGWRDTIVGNLGGAGFVYLLPVALHGGSVYDLLFLGVDADAR
ncbi:hypothetical protein ACFWIA_28565 [Streptomyces sp. NPDC127068]|uniref:hypothetical protein n=1 Tax=Streptomyces sp. NPDC127068 TaxID=3347127 RepID=UPI0036493C42